MLTMRVFIKNKEKIVAVCDSELIGKILKEGELVLNLEKYANFYKGDEVDEKKSYPRASYCYISKPSW